MAKSKDPTPGNCIGDTYIDEKGKELGVEIKKPKSKKPKKTKKSK